VKEIFRGFFFSKNFTFWLRIQKKTYCEVVFLLWELGGGGEGRSEEKKMDWSNVTAEELVDALKEVEWATPPRPLPEFFQKFTTPKTQSKWNARLKCNVY